MIYIYTMKSRVPGVARRLAKRLGTKVLRSDVVPTTLKRGDTILNYGGSTPPSWGNLLEFMDIKVINHWNNVDRSVDKLQTFRRLAIREIPTLAWTTHDWVAALWSRTVVRKLVRSTQSKGVLIHSGDGVLPEAPLYTEYWPKTHEFRVHVFDGEVIDYTQKKMLSKEQREKRGIKPIRFIRSYSNGWIFSRKDIYDLPEIRQLALDCTKAMGMDFCGVDILARLTKDGEFKTAVVCETNSAPGMVNTTFENYINKINDIQDKQL